jgi:hypothetical protein
MTSADFRTRTGTLLNAGEFSEESVDNVTLIPRRFKHRLG